MPTSLDHAVDLAVLTFRQHDFVPGVGVGAADDFDGRRLGSVAVGQPDALVEATQKVLINRTLDLHSVDARHVALGIEERLGELAVVRKEQEAFGVPVEPTD